MAFGIICEYNPLHNGHLHQINEIKKVSDEPIICVMSGNFTQRGEVSIVDKYARAQMALMAGASVVLELPVPFCISSAEYFASAGVEILHSVGVDKLCFGSESGDGESIIKTASVACSDDFISECKALSREEGSAAAYFALLAERSGVDSIRSNDILGIEYTKAILKKGYDMTIHTIKREGSAYLQATLCEGENPSATAIRTELFEGDSSKISSYVPTSTLEILNRSELYSLERAGDGILLALRLLDAESLDVAISDRGLINRIIASAHASRDYGEFKRSVQTKKYTSSAIGRAVLYILLGIKQSDLDALPAYTTLLGADKKGREYLSSIRRSESGIRIVTKPALAPECRQLELSERSDALYTMCAENKLESSAFIKKGPVIR